MEYSEERHMNAIDLNLVHVHGNSYRLPDSWVGNDVIFNLSNCGKEQLQIMTFIAKQLALVNDSNVKRIKSLERRVKEILDTETFEDNWQ